MVGHPAVQIRIVGVAGLLVAQRLEHPLDGGDRDAGRVRHRAAPEPVDVVELGELPAVVGCLVVLELGHRLLGQVVAVDQEQDAVEAAVLEQPVGQRHGGVGLARAGGHLHEAAVEALLAQARLDAVDRGDLRGAQRLARPAAAGRGPCRATSGARSSLRLRTSARVAGLGEVEDPPRARVGIEAVGEVGLGAAGLEHERQPSVLRQRREADVGGQPVGVRRADCHSTPDSGVPSGLASITPTTRWST